MIVKSSRTFVGSSNVQNPVRSIKMYLPYDDAGEEEDKHDDDDSDHSAPQSEYEIVCDRNIAEMQQKMNELGINNLFVKKTPAAKRNKAKR